MALRDAGIQRQVQLAAAPALPQPLLLGAGLVCLGWAAFVLHLGRQEAPSPRLVRAAAVLNALWALDCVLAPALGLLAPNGLGLALLLGQAALVMGFAVAQWAGLRQAQGLLPA